MKERRYFKDRRKFKYYIVFPERRLGKRRKEDKNAD